ncbi:conserved hypothetical protein [Candidatus Liberibacter solanacearum]
MVVVKILEGNHHNLFDYLLSELRNVKDIFHVDLDLYIDH